MKFGKTWVRLIGLTVTAEIVFAVSVVFAVRAFALDSSFRPGEKITYEIVGQIKEWRMKGTLGYAEVTLLSLETLKGKSIYRAVATVSSSFLVKSRYELKDVFYSWFDAKTFQTYRVEKIQKEGEYTNHVIIDVDSKTGVVTEVDKGDPKGRRYNKPRNAYDFLSFFYWLRSAKQSKSFTLTLFDGEWTKQIPVSITPGEDTKVPALDKNKKLKTLVMKENKAYGLEIKLAKDFSYVPITMAVVNVSASKARLTVHITAQGILTSYRPGK